jgi:hypothetical protein
VSVHHLGDDERKRLLGYFDDVAPKTFRELSPRRFTDAERQRDLEEFERAARVEMGLPEGPLDLADEVLLRLEVETYRIFMQRVFYGTPVVEASNPEAGESPILGMLRRSQRGLGADLTWFDDATDFGYSPSRGIPRQEPRLGPLPIITRDETENHYGTSGELEPRGYWMKCDVESDHRPWGETQA